MRPQRSKAATMQNIYPILEFDPALEAIDESSRGALYNLLGLAAEASLKM